MFLIFQLEEGLRVIEPHCKALFDGVETKHKALTAESMQKVQSVVYVHLDIDIFF